MSNWVHWALFLGAVVMLVDNLRKFPIGHDASNRRSTGFRVLIVIVFTWAAVYELGSALGYISE